MRTIPLSELMTRQVITVTPQTSIAEALAIMSDRRISCLVVQDQGKPLGILTERDLVKHYAEVAASNDQSVVGIMTPSPVTVSADVNQFTAFKQMKAGHFRHLVVTGAAGEVIGVVTETDFVRHLGVDFYLRPKDVLSAMAAAVTADVDCPLDEVIALLALHRTFCVLITRQGLAVGILTERDIVSLLKASRNGNQRKEAIRVGEVMGKPLRSIPAEASLLDASELLGSSGFRHLAVLDHEGKPLGVIGEHEIVKGLESEYVVHLEDIIVEKNSALAALKQAQATLEQQSSALRSAVDELMTSHAELREMVGSTVHDLQEPTRVIVGFSQLLMTRHADKLDDEGRELLQFVIEGTLRMNNQIRDLATYASVAVQQDLTETVDAEILARTAADSLQEIIGKSGATLTIAPLPRVRLQASALLVIFEQMIANAITYRHPERPPIIIIEGESTAEGAHLRVRDNGLGIAPEYQDKIFDLFERLSPPSKNATGAGLAICRRIVRAVQGRIWVESKPGEGSCFHVLIPD